MAEDSPRLHQILKFVDEYRERIYAATADDSTSYLPSFAERFMPIEELSWIQHNYDKFLFDSPNDTVVVQNYLSEMGFITAIVFSPDAGHVVTGHSTGLIQALMNEFAQITRTDLNGKQTLIWYPMFSKVQKKRDETKWVQNNYEKFTKGTENKNVYNRMFLSEWGAITALVYNPVGTHIVVGHASGLIQVRHGTTGAVLCTLRHIQFPPTPIFGLEYSKTEERVCYATCTDGAIYRLEIPPLALEAVQDTSFHLKRNPCLESLNVQFYGTPGISNNLTPFIVGDQIVHPLKCWSISNDVQYQFPPHVENNALLLTRRQTEGSLSMRLLTRPCNKHVNNLDQTLSYRRSRLKVRAGSCMSTGRPVPLCIGIAAETERMAVGFADSSIKIYDMETQEPMISYKIHKGRLNFTPKKLQRMHTGAVTALCCHPTRPTVFATGSWDETLRIWDTRCKIGCMMTFEGVNIIGNSVDLNRDLCIAGSWQPLEALTVWDLVAKKKLSDVRAQNRRPDVDGEYIYACKFWRSADYNRKGKYAIIGGSGTKCLEVINLHNRYIACSYPVMGSILAVASHHEKIAYGGTAAMFCLANFHDPKHEDVYVRGDRMENVGKWASTLDDTATTGSVGERPLES